MIVFQCQDKDGIKVLCDKDTWDNHIVSEHPEMKSCEAYVTVAVHDPYQIYQDSSDLQKKVVYKPFILPKPYDRQYLRVVIEYHKKKRVGYICTAFPCINKKKGDILIWEKS